MSTSPTLTLKISADQAGITELHSLLEQIKLATSGLSTGVALNSREASAALRAEELDLVKHNSKKTLLAEKLSRDISKISTDSSAMQIAAENKLTQMLISESVKRNDINEKAKLKNEELNRAQTQAMVAEAYKMNAAIDAASADRASKTIAMKDFQLAEERKLTQAMVAEAYKMNSAIDVAEAARLAKYEANLVKQAELDVAYSRASLAQQLKIRKDLAATQANPTLGSSYAATKFAPAAVSDTRSVAEMEAALLKQGGAAKSAAAGHAELNAMMREGHSLARGMAGPLNAMWLTWGSLAPLLAGAAISSAIVGSVKAGSDFEMVLSRIQGVSGETKAKVDQAGEAFKKLAEDSLFSASDVATGSQILVQAGLSLTEATKALPTIMQLASVGELNMSNAAEIATGTMNAFGLSIKEIPGVANVLSKAADMSQTNIGEMGEAMKQASTVAQQYGVNLIDMSAGIATLAQVNIRGSAAGTAYKNMLTNLASPTEKGAKELAHLGVSAFDADGKMKDMTVTFSDLSEALKGLNDADKAAAVNGIFSERGAKGAINYMNALDSGKIREFTTALRGVAETQDYLSGKQDLLNNTVGAQGSMAFHALGVAMIDAFDSSETGLLELTRSFKEFLQSEAFKQGLKDIVSGFVTLVNVVKEAIPYVASLMAGFAVSKFAFAAAGAVALAEGLTLASAGAVALEFALGPVGLAIAAAAAVWYIFRDKAVESLDVVDSRIHGSIDLMHRLADENYKSTKSDVSNANLAVRNANEELRLAKAAQAKLANGGSAEVGLTYAQQAEKNKVRVVKALTEVELAQKNAQTLANKLFDETQERSASAAAIEAKPTSTATSNYKTPEKVDKEAESRRARENSAITKAAQEDYSNAMREAKRIEAVQEDIAKQKLAAHQITLDQYQKASDEAYAVYADSAMAAETTLSSKLRATEKTGNAESDRINLEAKRKKLKDDRTFAEQTLRDAQDHNTRAALIEADGIEKANAAKLNNLNIKADNAQAKTQDKFDRRFDAPTDNVGENARIKAEKEYQDEIDKTTVKIKELQDLLGNDKDLIAQDIRIKKYTEANVALEEAKTRHGDVAAAAAKANDKIAKSWQEGATQAVHEYMNATQDSAKITHDLVTKSISGMTDALATFVKTGKLDFKTFAASIIEDLIRIQIQEQATKAFSALGSLAMSALGSLGGGGGLSGNTGAVSGAVYAANGHAFDNGKIAAFANGGAFTNSVVNTPTTFPLGVMGEAGPEAIMPLTRDSSGRLGVQSSGSGGSGGITIQNNVTVQVQAGENADKTGDIVSEKIMQTMKNIADGQIANSMRLGGMLNKVHN
ncbi:phage tail tape measure protein [Methylotenera sp.]|uniref:phage tail tape measure protein n=1 Tax=Methylotenera sp. TaxID=2051956 RepID=UPI002488FFA1|nr:phage tail tape measure protein [Methylotenera sp.]MDI1362509.1 phage tail tape measure protein [Methylotenera sp.]